MELSGTENRKIAESGIVKAPQLKKWLKGKTRDWKNN